MSIERAPRRPRPSQRPAARDGQGTRRRNWLGIAAYGALGIGCFLLGALAFLIVAPPIDGLRDQVVQQVKARTGRDLVVGGPASLSFFPRPAVTLSDVALSGPPGREDEAILTAASIGAEVPISSLLTGSPDVRRIVMTRPTITLKVDAQGRRNWDLASAQLAPERGMRTAGAWGLVGISRAEAQAAGALQSSVTAALAKVVPTSVRFVDGTVRYEDARTSEKHEANSVNIDLTLDDLAGPLQINGSLGWRGEQMTIVGALSPAGATLEGQPGRLAAKVSGRTVEASFDGRLAIADGPKLEGSVSAKATSGAALEQWIGKRVLGAAGSGELRLTSTMALANGVATLSDLSASAGEATLSGSISVDTKPERPFVRGTLHVSEVDFARLLMRPEATAPSAGSQAAPPTPSENRAAPSPAAPAKPQVRGFTRRSGEAADWSDEVIDLQPLGIADADLKLTADRLVFKDLKTGPARFALALTNRVAKLTLDDVVLYDGRCRGVLILDGTAEVPATATNVRLDGVSTKPLLKDALGFDWLAGRGSIALALTGQGVSERQIMQTLNGKIDLTAADGSVSGADVSKILRNIEQGRFLDIGLSPEEKTSFSEFAGTFTISNGIATNQDLRLTSANLKVSGAGTVDLPARKLDYTVRPKIVGSAGGDRALIKLEGIEIPLRIAGPWEKPELEVTGKDQVSETLKQIGKNLKSEDVQNAIKGLLGGEDGKRVKPRELLEKFLGK